MKLFVQRTAERILRWFLPEMHRRVALLEWKVSCTQNALDFAITDDWCRWLYLNRGERMDATVDFFDPGRRQFHLDRYLFAAPYLRNKAVADIACGTGYGSELLRKVGSANSVVGVDIEPQAVDYGSHKHGGEGIRFVCAPGESTGLEGSAFDVVVSFETIEHVADDENLLQEFSRLLRPDGLLICSTPNQWPLHLTEHHVREYDMRSFEEVLERSFAIKEMYNQNSGNPRGPFNRGQPAGIVETTQANAESAECFIAVCAKRPE